MPHYDRYADPSAEQNDLNTPSEAGIDNAALDGAAEALREVEVQAAKPEAPEGRTDSSIVSIDSLTSSQLESMNIDELRAVAKELDIPDRATITDRDELIAAIRQLL
jgi:hypothetical protein